MLIKPAKHGLKLSLDGILKSSTLTVVENIRELNLSPIARPRAPCRNSVSMTPTRRLVSPNAGTV